MSIVGSHRLPEHRGKVIIPMGFNNRGSVAMLTGQSRAALWLAVCVCIGTGAGCGQKGDLYLPDEKETTYYERLQDLPYG